METHARTPTAGAKSERERTTHLNRAEAEARALLGRDEGADGHAVPPQSLEALAARLPHHDGRVEGEDDGRCMGEGGEDDGRCGGQDGP